MPTRPQVPWLLAAALLVAGAAACTDATLLPVAPEDAVGPGSSFVRGLPGDPVVVAFGREHVGSSFPPPSGHDASFHAKDAIRPRNIVVAAGSTVRFMVAPAHKAAVYEPGVEPADIDVTMLEFATLPFPFPPLVNDPAGRLARGELNTNFATGQALPFEHTFEEPGRYLVICEVLPHFTEAKMYAWVVVK